jgi:glucose/arabinose dehydrogenase
MKRRTIWGIAALVVTGAAFYSLGLPRPAQQSIAALTGPTPTIAPPHRTLIPTINIAKAVGWPAGTKPIPAPGLAVDPFAEGLDHPRWLFVLPNGDVLAAETNAPPRPGESKGIKSLIQGWVMGAAGAKAPSANRITLLRDANGDGVAELKTPFLTGLASPFGMALIGDALYVANANAVVRFPYRPGDTRITAAPVKLVDLPGGPINHHWTKGLVASPDGTRLYVSVGSNSNVGERGMAAEEGRAAIWEVDPATGHHRIYASGMRNPVGMAWEPRRAALWAVVNERDELGSDLVPDYLTQVQFAAFYGWPYHYWGGYPDPRIESPDESMQQYVARPDYALGPHTASLGLAFAGSAKLGTRFAEGAFIGQHGSWNREPRSGYKVIFVPFANGRPAGMPIDVLTGFLDADGQAQGRPVGVVTDRSGALLVADDVGNRIWRVRAAAPEALPR